MKLFHKNILNSIKAIVFAAMVLILVLHGFLDIAVFKSLEYRIKKEVKGIIKSGLSDEELTLLKFHKSITDKSVPGFEWKEDKEFRYRNEMYDIVRQEAVGDSIYYYCFHDTEESELFADFDKKIRDYLAGGNNDTKDLKTLLNSINKYYNSSLDHFDLTIYTGSRYLAAYVDKQLPTGFHHINIPPPRPAELT